MQSRASVMWAVMLGAGLGVCLAGCAAGPEAAAAETQEQARAEQADMVQAERAAVTHRLQALPEVGAVQLVVGSLPGGGAAQHVNVEVVRSDGRPVDAALAQRIVDLVLEGFPDLPAMNVAVRDGSQPDFLYLGDLGVME